MVNNRYYEDEVECPKCGRIYEGRDLELEEFLILEFGKCNDCIYDETGVMYTEDDIENYLLSDCDDDS